MKENEMKSQADPVLDAELAQMAEEVPPMPADFHEKWMNAVRSEAQQSASAVENTETKAPVSLIRWTRILSIAAVFVFLIGGTILYRNSQKTLTSAAFRTEAKNSVMLSVEAPAAGAIPEEREETEAPEKDAAEGAVMIAAESAETEMVMEEYAVPNEAASYDAGDYAAEYDDAEESVMYEEVQADPGAYEAAPMVAMKGAEMPAATLMPTEAPTIHVTESAPEEEEASEEETAGKTEEESGQEAETAQKEAGLIQQAGLFLRDMGSFLLAALPYLLVLAVPAVAALILRRKRK